MRKPVVRFIILTALAMALMGALVYRLGQLTIVEGGAWAASAEKRSTKTIAVKGERGRILDRNGVVLAYDETCYNVQFLRDADNRTSYDSSVYTESLIRVIDIIEREGGSTIDTSYIVMGEDGALTYDWRVTSDTAVKARYKNFCEAMGLTIRDQNYVDYPDDPSVWDLSQWPTAEYAYNYLRRSWYIPEEYTFEQAKKIISIRQEVNLNNYRAYEPITIAYDVGEGVVSEIMEHSDELVGMQVAQSTTRVYPRGTLAAHILGYMQQTAGKVSESALLALGYTKEQLEPYYLVDEDDKYVYSETGEHLIDMTGKMGYSYDDFVGVSGVESTMEAYLTGATSAHKGSQEVEINMNGSIIRRLSETPATNGNDVMLTIDAEFQAVAEKALADLIEKIAAEEQALIAADEGGEYAGKDIDIAKTGAIVVMDPQTGELYAMASYPTFDPNWFIQGLTDEQKEYLGLSSEPTEEAKDTTPLRNKAISARFAPGSIFKMVTGVAGVAEDAIAIDEKINDRGDSGYYYIYNEDGSITKTNAPRCWKTNHEEHANLTLTGAVTVSCNFFFCEVAHRLGIDLLNEWAGRFGLTKSTNIELTGEATGICGGQDVLFDNGLDDAGGELSVSGQKTSLPLLIYKRLCERLSEYVSLRGMEIDDEAVSGCALRLMKLQDGNGLDGKGPDIRRIISEELGIPEGYTAAQPWTSEIVTLLNEIQWKPTLTIRTGYGQGVTLVTPVAVARYASAIANEGYVYDANIVDKIIGADGSLVKDINAALSYRIGDDGAEWQALWAAIKAGMKGVVSEEDHGTAAGKFSEAFRDAGYVERIAGKTGTAQIGLSSIDIEDTSWFISYTPREGDAELVVIICVPSGYSGSWGVSAAEEIYTYYFQKMDSAAAENLVDIDGNVP
ncbi:MAG TPA: penicillin-binding transpeptidase domain-containing protein [Clostridia bacterium]|nr:penicillin-binding transpeptidase domain-containing protein [Clostridia bacterium]